MKLENLENFHIERFRIRFFLQGKMRPAHLQTEFSALKRILHGNSHILSN